MYSGISLPKDDTASGITNLTTAIQKAYSGSVVSSYSVIKDVLNITGGGNIVSLGSSIITNYLGGSINTDIKNPVILSAIGGITNTYYSGGVHYKTHTFAMV